MKTAVKNKSALFLTVLFACLFLFAGMLYSQDENKLTLHQKNTSLIIKDKISESQAPIAPVNLNDLIDNLNKTDNFSAIYENTQKKKKKSVGLGILLSALLPGAGEFYGENYIKAAIFFGVELLAWGTYFYFENKGNTKTDEYKAYADQYWDVRTYARWLKENDFDESSQINPEEPNRSVLEEQIRICERANFSHTLPEWKSQQYYELIGKYQNFQAGWTNLEHVPNNIPGSPYNYQTYRDPIFTNYANNRQQANDFYDYAKIGPVTAIVNHILSAADAAWVISTYNSNIKVETGFRLENRMSPYTYRHVQIPTFNLNVKF